MTTGRSRNILGFDVCTDSSITASSNTIELSGGPNDSDRSLEHFYGSGAAFPDSNLAGSRDFVKIGPSAVDPIFGTVPITN